MWYGITGLSAQTLPKLSPRRKGFFCSTGSLKQLGTQMIRHPQAAASRPRPVDDTSIPFGEIREVTGAMDLRKKVKIGTLDDDG